MTISDFLHITWSAPGDPLIEPPRFSPVIADPSFLFPEETPSGEWELFAHSAWGIHRYSSGDGLSWRDRGLVVRNAMRPFIRRIGAEFFLYYEKYAPLALPLTALPFKKRWKSTIAMSTSTDLARWSAPRTLVRPELDWMRDPVLGDSVSNPCLVDAGAEGVEDWRLYFSASLVWLDDCGFCEPRYIAMARGNAPAGPFSAEPRPIVDPADDVPADDVPVDDIPVDDIPATEKTHAALGAGSMKVLRLDDDWIGLQNRIYLDHGGKSRSAIFELRSGDGIAWQPVRSEPLLHPAPGWTSSHVYACDCRYREADGTWYLYFNARDGWSIAEGKERIGRILGTADRFF